MGDNAKVLVTGATGWLGRRLVARLIGAGFRVSCLIPPGEWGKGMDAVGTESYRGDITQRDFPSGFFEDAEGAVLCHCAGIIHAKPKVLHDVNARGTASVMSAAVRAGVRRVVYVSSNSPFGFNPGPDYRFYETSPASPYMAYGRSKLMAEYIIKSACAPIERVIVRPTWFYGPGQPARQTEFFKMIRDGKAPILGDGTNKRSMTYVDNLVDALLLCGTLPQAAGETYWISDETPYSMMEIVTTIRTVLENDFGIPCKDSVMRLPRLAGKVAQWVDWGLQKCGQYNQKIHVLGEMGETIACCVNKAKRELGWRPKVALCEGMRRSIQYLLDKGVTL